MSSNLEKAVRGKVRWESNKGLLSPEDVYDLSLNQLNTMAKGLKRSLKASEEEDFLDDVSKEDVLTKLKFDIVLDILETKKAEKKEALEASGKKEERQKIIDLIAKKEDEDLSNLSKEELMKRLNEL